MMRPIAAEISTARGLPNAAYTAAEVLAAERRHVFASAWTCIGIADDVPARGDVAPVRCAGQPLLLLRDHDDQIRVFHNVCRHRGTRLVNSRRNCSQIVCPYHSWTYALDGTLRRTPNFGGSGKHGQDGFDPSAHGMLPVRNALWNRLVFVNLDGRAPPLEEWMAPLARRWAHFDLSLIRHGAGVSYDINANWKLVTENFLESYHLPSVHAGLARYSPLADHNLILEGESFFGQQSTHYQPQDSAAGVLPCFPGLSDEQRRTAEYVCLFPNVWLSCVADHFRLTIIEPVAADRTEERWEFFFVGDRALSDKLAPARAALVERVCQVTDEDISILHELQAGRASIAFDGGRFSAHHERTVHRFQRMVSARIARHE